MRRTARMYGVEVDLLTMDELVDRCAGLIESGRFAQQTSLNAGKVVLMADDPSVRAAVAGSDLVTADGQSIVWAGRAMGHSVPERVAGIDLMERLLALSEKCGYPVYFLGARPEVLATFMAIVRARYPGLTIAGSTDGYFSDGSGVAGGIGASGARVLFIAMPSPNKELFIARHFERLGGLLAVGVGGSFDVWTGVTRRAPEWMQRTGLEWFFRFVQEPRRMWKRYLVGNTRFMSLTVREMIGNRRSDETKEDRV